MKTIKLTARPRVQRERVSDILSAAVVLSVLLFARAALNGPAAAVVIPPRAIAPTTAPIILIATHLPITPQPTWTPAPTWTPQPTLEPVVIIEQAPTQPAEVIYVQVEAPPPAEQPVFVEPAAPTPEPAAPSLAPQQMVLLDRGAWAAQAATAKAGR